MKTLLSLKSGTIIFLVLTFLSFSKNVLASDFTSATVIGAANKLATLQIYNISISSIDVTDVTNDLEPGHVQVLNDMLMKVDSDNVLNRLLRRAKLIGSKEIVVGVITTTVGEIDTVLVAKKKSLR